MKPKTTTIIAAVLAITANTATAQVTTIQPRIGGGYTINTPGYAPQTLQPQIGGGYTLYGGQPYPQYQPPVYQPTQPPAAVPVPAPYYNPMFISPLRRPN